jgi:AcrR family transcriptional regulator
MNVKRRRRYNSAQRAVQANATRSQILATAEALFAARGFATVTMESIAREAGVSLATVYVHFGGKSAIVAALAEQVVAARDLSVEQVEQEVDPVCQVRIGARIMRQLNQRSWLVADILRSAHQTDSSLAETWERWQQQHLEAIRRAVKALEAGGALRAGLSRNEAVDTFYALTGTEVYRSLVRERRWSPARYERWLFRVACSELLGIVPSDSPPYPQSCPPADRSDPSVSADARQQALDR